MENNSKISNIYIYFIMIYYNLSFTSISYSSNIMKDFTKSAWMIPLFWIIPLLILIFFYKSKNNFDSLKNNTFFKILLLINSLIHNIVLIYISSHMMGISFYHLTPVSLFAITTLIITCFLSFLDIKKILRLAFILITGLIWFIPFIFDFEFNNNFQMELLDNININFLKGYYFTTVCLDLFLYTLYNKEYKKPISKKGLTVVFLIILICASLQIIDSYTLVNYRYYEGIDMPSLNRYFSHQGKRFFEHFDILLLFLTLTTTFYKVSFNTILVKETFDKAYQNKFIFFYFLTLTPLVFYLILNYKHLDLLLLTLFFTTALISIIIIIYSRWEKFKCIKK